MFNKSKYSMLLTCILIITIILVIGIIIIFGYKMYNSYYITTGAAHAVKQFEQAIQNNLADIKYKEFTVIGTIEIPDIDFNYPILQENTTEALETSVVLMYTGQGLNKRGNTVITGHNYRNGTMFSDLKELIKGDYIYITDITGEKVRYKIYSIYTVDDNQNDYITRKVGEDREISLSTSTDNAKGKIIILAKEG